MKYESDILKMIHENAITEFQLGLISEAEMHEYDEVCLTPETLQDTAKGNIANETISIEHIDLITA